MSPTILLVEDEVVAAEMLTTFLELNNFNVISIQDGQIALDLLRSTKLPIDLAILDIMVPGVDGKELCSYIRKHPQFGQIPVIFLTAKDQEQDEIMGLNLGADDYIPKPASLNLILAHVKTLLRRRGIQPDEELRFGDIRIELSSGLVQVAENPVDLTLREMKILELLFRSPKRVFSRQEILEHISDDEKHVFDRTIDAHIKNLRLKLGKSGQIIKTYRGLGYGLDRSYVLDTNSR
ncbi:MAG TPA: DNA-binding response regulator [Bacteroidetes bacterium]|nr:DNA-binding response regulator [Bacteroidota bacterium]